MSDPRRFEELETDAGTLARARQTQAAIQERAIFTQLFRTAVAVLFLLVLIPTTAHAATQIRTDPSDAPAGTFGKADLRNIAWDVGGASAALTVDVDASTYGAGDRALIGAHVMLDTDTDGIADHEVVATRNADGLRIDLVLRNLDQTLSTADCQDLAGSATAAQQTVTTTVADGLETFTFAFDPALVPGGLSAFRWAAFGQAPPDGAVAGPWDVMPDAANPDPSAANPSDRRCNTAGSGLRVRMSDGYVFPDAGPSDADADGVPDAADSCVLQGGIAGNGCPDIDRTLSLAYNEERMNFKGTLRPAGPCATGHKVKVFRVRAGGDKKVGAATTKPSGRFNLADGARAGRYYAKAGAKTIAGTGNCLAAKSKRTRVA